MPFSETLKQKVKERANFTCCWCLDRDKTVDIHHIIPQADNGPDTEDNAAPLCASCHRLYGSNPELRKEMRQRRDAWYQKCSNKPEFLWPIELDVPLLAYSRAIPAKGGLPIPGIQLTDKEPSGTNGPPLLYLSIHFKTTRYFLDYVEQTGEKWLYVQADMRPAFSMRIQVFASNRRDINEIMKALQTSEGAYNLQGPNPQGVQGMAGDDLYIRHEAGEKRLTMATLTPTLANISIHARLTNNAAQALAEYLEQVGFTQ